MSQLKVWDSVNKVWIPAVVGAAGLQGPAGQGVPTGGTTGQALVKTSNTVNYQTAWQDISSGVSSVDGATGAVSLTNSYDAKGTSGLKSKFDGFLAKANGPTKAFPTAVVPSGYGAYAQSTTVVGTANFVPWDSANSFYYRGLVQSTVTISGKTYVRNDPLNNLSYNVYWVEFDHYGTQFDALFAAASAKTQIWVWVDGVPTTSASAGTGGATGAPMYYHVALGNSAAQRRIRIMFSSTDFAGIYMQNSTDTIFAVQQNLLKVVLFGGSWFQGGSGNVANLSDQLSVQLGEMLNVDYYVLAIGGTGYVNGNNPNPPYDPVLGYNVKPLNTNGPSWVYPSRLTPMATIQPDLVIFLGTTNDDTLTGSSYQLGAHATYVYDYVKNLGLNTKIISFARQSNGMTDATYAANALAVYNAALAHPSVIGASNEYDEGWIAGNASIFIYSDDHPNTAGSKYYATRMFNRISDFVKTYTRS